MISSNVLALLFFIFKRIAVCDKILPIIGGVL